MRAERAVEYAEGGVMPAKEFLKQKDAKFRLLFQDNPLPMWVYDGETLRFLEVNEAAVAHYGYSREEFLNMTVADTWAMA